MELTVTGRKKAVTDRFRRHLEDKLDKIPQLAPRVSRIEVVLTHEGNPRQAKMCERVEITCFIQRTVAGRRRHHGFDAGRGGPVPAPGGGPARRRRNHRGHPQAPRADIRRGTVPTRPGRLV